LAIQGVTLAWKGLNTQTPGFLIYIKEQQRQRTMESKCLVGSLVAEVFLPFIRRLKAEEGRK
jgi:hypothetical protein